MDFFDRRYYSLTRKLLLLIGQWPYQDQADRNTRTISIICIILTMLAVQVAKLLTTRLTLNLVAEVLSTQVVSTICFIKFASYAVQTKKIKALLETMKADWKSLTAEEDRKIANEYAEKGRKYNFFSMVYLYLALALAVTVCAAQPLIEIIYPMNETYVKVTLYQGEYFVDTDKYFYPILLHMTLTVGTLITILIATDSMYISYIYHACGMFCVVSHRLEHAFDTYKDEGTCRRNEKSEAHTRIANAVDYHKNATEYTNFIISTFEVPLFMQIFLVFINITVTLYCMTVSLGSINEMMASLLLVICQMIQALLVAYPCQNVVDTSSAISFNAYSGLWYLAPFRIQALVLPVIQRGTKPTMIYASKLMLMTLESYAMAIQISLSYFTVLLSFR